MLKVKTPFSTFTILGAPMISTQNIEGIHEWIAKFGGHGTYPAAHALKILGEAIELAIAAGANQRDINLVVKAEISKAISKFEIKQTFRINPVVEECADVAITLAAFCHHFQIPLNAAVRCKLPILNSREWKADEAGVLRRPERTRT